MESEPEEESPDKGLDPRILKALKEAMPLKIDSDFLTKVGWVSHPSFPQMIVGHFPKTFRTPVTRYPKHVIRTTWVFNKKWVEIEKEVDIRTLDNRVAKLPNPPVISVTIFKRPADDPEPEPDSDREAEAVPSDKKAYSPAQAAGRKFGTQVYTPSQEPFLQGQKLKCWRRMPESEGGAPLSFRRSSETT